MYKLILILVVFFASNTYMNARSVEQTAEEKELCQWEYWNAFSKTFIKTHNFWEAESAALEALDNAEEKTGVEEWLEETNQESKEDSSKTFVSI